MLIGCGETETRATRVKDGRASLERREGSFTDSRNLIGSLQCDRQMDSSSGFFFTCSHCGPSQAWLGSCWTRLETQQNQEPGSDAEFLLAGFLCDGATAQRDLDWRQTAKAKGATAVSGEPQRPSRTNRAFFLLCVFLFPPSSSSVWAPQQMDAGDKGPGFRSIWRVRLEAFTSWWLQTGSRQSGCQEKRLWNNTATKISYTLI